MDWDAALDSSAGASLALRGPDGVTHLRRLPLVLRTGEQELANWLQAELASVGASILDVRRWTVGTGPGSFSGLRVGIALLKGGCAGSGARLRGVPGCLAMVLAASARQPEVRSFTTLHDARQRQLIVSRYAHTGSGWVEQEPPFVANAETVAQFLTDKATTPVTLQGALPPGLLPDSAGTVELAEFPVAEWLALPWSGAADAECEPVYVRPPVFTPLAPPQ